MADANDVLRVARGEIGYSRWTDPQQGTKYGRWFAELVKSRKYAESGTPYCAMFVTWVFYHANAGDKLPGLPGAYCPTMLAEARAYGRVVPVAKAQPGDVVYFDWHSDGVTDHVGIVEVNNGRFLTCIEGNTTPGDGGNQSNGGVVARRNRAYANVLAAVRPSYATPARVVLAEDGVFGPASVGEAQSQLGVQVTHAIAGQSAAWKPRLWGITAIRYGGGGAPVVGAIQKRLGLPVDNYLGPVTISGVQKRLGVDSDGYWGADTSLAFQRALNRGEVRSW